MTGWQRCIEGVAGGSHETQPRAYRARKRNRLQFPRVTEAGELFYGVNKCILGETGKNQRALLGKIILRKSIGERKALLQGIMLYRLDLSLRD